MAETPVILWWLALDRIGAADWERLERSLDDGERERARRFHFPRDRQAYVAAHALARALLSRWSPRPPADWRFVTGPFGKPEVLCPPDQPHLRINLSHTRGLAAAAVTVDHDLGVDVEWLERELAVGDLARRFFAPAECAALAAAPPERAAEMFLSLWTLKEACLKATGAGLSQPLDAVAFTLQPLSVSFAPAFADDPDHWLFCRFRPSPAHLMALAVRHPRSPPPVVVAQPADLDSLLG